MEEPVNGRDEINLKHIFIYLLVKNKGPTLFSV